MQTSNSKHTNNHYTLKNVRLETGFFEEESGITGTQTELFCVEIKDGKIVKIYPNDAQSVDTIDAKGLLMLPSFKDMHIHLDKTLYGLPCRHCRPNAKRLPI